MGIKLAVKTKFALNNKEYERVEDLPPELRDLYEKAMASGATPGRPSTRIVINGKEYDSPDALPAWARLIYKTAMARVEAASPARTSSAAETASPAAPATPATAAAEPHEAPDIAIEPTSGSRWTLVALLGGVGLLVAWLLLR